MKILVISDVFFPKISGYAQVINSVYSKMLKSNFLGKVQLVCSGKQEFGESENINGIQIVRFDSLILSKGRIVLPSPNMVFSIFREIKKFKPDQIHIHSRISVTSFVAFLVAKILGVPVIIVDHLADYISGESFLVNSICYIWDKTISKIMLSFCDKIIAVSKSVSFFEQTKLGISQNKINVIENGCNFKLFNLNYQQKYQSKKFFNILFAARMVSLKNPILVINLCKVLVKKGYSNFHIRMAGDGKLLPEVKKLIAKNKLQDYVTILGKINTNQMVLELQKSDFFLNPSYLEGLPGCVMEATSQTTIPVVTNIGGNNDLIKIPECLVDLQNISAESLSQKIIYLFEIIQNSKIQNKDQILSQKKLLLDKLEKQRQSIYSYYTWDKAVKKYEQSILKIQESRYLKVKELSLT
jgi:glycosyltransferase involved in cell wall biosynthesis